MADFSEAWSDLPYWMTSVIESDLGQRGRFVSATDVKKGIELIVAQGKVPTMESVGRLVGSKEAKAVRDQLQRRTLATGKERSRLISGLRVVMNEGPTLRVTSRQMRARNVLAVLIAIVTKEPIAQVLTWPRERLLGALSVANTSQAQNKATLKLLNAAFFAVDAMHLTGASKGDQRPFLQSFRGGSMPSRGAATMLRRAMEGMDSRLQRSADVFFTNVALPISAGNKR